MIGNGSSDGLGECVWYPAVTLSRLPSKDRVHETPINRAVMTSPYACVLIEVNSDRGKSLVGSPYCVSCELLSAFIADALLFVNIPVSGIFHGRFAQRLAVNKPCLQIVRHLL